MTADFKHRRAFAVCLGWIWLAGSAGASGQAATSASQPPDAAAEAKDDGFLDKLTIHGFLSQAYAFSDGNQIVGIPQDGTADYRTAALQIRAEITKADTFAVQFSHERLGLSPVQSIHDDVELDWVFYERRFGASAIKVGRLPIPFGIYNEVRDVGTVLPLYRPGRPMYEETSFATETVDGGLVSHTFDWGSWSLATDVHYGNWESFDGRLNPVKADDSLGAELWLQTPVSGLRFGVGGLRHDSKLTAGTTVTRTHRQLSHFSLDGDFERVDAQVEVKRDTSQLVTGGRSGDVWGGYGHLGVHLFGKLVVHGELDFLDVKVPHTDKASDRDRATGVSYFFRPDLVLKAEYHWVHGFRVEGRPGLIPGRPVPDYKTQFGILSLSTSF